MALVVGVAVALQALAVPTAGARVTDGAVEPVAPFGGMATAPGGGQVYVAGMHDPNALVVLDDAGVERGRVAGQRGASGVATSADGATIYVALRRDDAVSAIDARTLAERDRFPLPPGSAPRSVAVAGGRIWVAHARGVSSLDPTSARAAWRPDHVAAHPGPAPLIAVDGDRLVVLDGRRATTTYHRYTVTPGGVVPAATRSSTGRVRDVVLVPGTDRLVVATAAQSHGQILDADRLTSEGLYAVGPSPNAVASTPDGQLVAVGSDAAHGTNLTVWRTGPPATMVLAGDLPPDVELAPRGLALSADGRHLFAAVRDRAGRGLHVLEFRLPAATVRDVRPGTAWNGSRLPVAFPVDRARPAAVEVEVGGRVVGSDPTPPYVVRVDDGLRRRLPEGPARIRVRVVRADGAVVTGPPRSVVIDRTRPTGGTVTVPLSADARGWVTHETVVRADEPVSLWGWRVRWGGTWHDAARIEGLGGDRYAVTWWVPGGYANVVVRGIVEDRAGNLAPTAPRRVSIRP